MGKYKRIRNFFIVITSIFCLTIASTPNVQNITFGIIFPTTIMISSRRAQTKVLRDTFVSLRKTIMRSSFINSYNIYLEDVKYLEITPSPMEILDVLCNKLQLQNVVAIIYFTNAEQYGINTASVKYLLQLTGYMGMPVIAWNPDNIGLEQTQRLSDSKVLQLAPSINHQLAAMLSILRRYSWKKFSVITTQIGGYEDFLHAVWDQVHASEDFEFDVMNVVIIKGKEKAEILDELQSFSKSESRVTLLYSSRDEARIILDAANDLKITGKNYIWIVTKPVIGDAKLTDPVFPPGMLGVYFNTSQEHFHNNIEAAVSILVHGLISFANDSNNANISLLENLQCNGSGSSTWVKGMHFFKYLRSVNIEMSRP